MSLRGCRSFVGGLTFNCILSILHTVSTGGGHNVSLMHLGVALVRTRPLLHACPRQGFQVRSHIHAHERCVLAHRSSLLALIVAVLWVGRRMHGLALDNNHGPIDFSFNGFKHVLMSGVLVLFLQVHTEQCLLHFFSFPYRRHLVPFQEPLSGRVSIGPHAS